LGASTTVSEIAAVSVRLPDVPVIFTVALPVAAALEADSVTVLVLDVELALNEAVTPAGRPEAVRVTFALNPFSGLTVIVALAVFPCARLRLADEEESVKVGGGTIVTPMVTVLVTPAEVPVTVMVELPAAAAVLAARFSVLTEEVAV
jgi:hypothetical protein